MTKQKEVNLLKEKSDTVRAKHQSLKQSLDKDKNEFQVIEQRYYEIEKKYAVNKASLDKYKQDLFLFQE
ncbi:MAG: hypothetical protein LRY27_00655, partial [Chitinophagales bacterium]|nr:hypothetical protein [Chitinophagales bacterium]